MYDYHTHTSYSDDADTPIAELIETAVQLGIKELAITDHYDPGYTDPEFPFDLDFASYQKSLLEMSARFKDQIKLVKGIEIGIMDSEFAKCSAAVSQFSYDFVIGSFHSLHQDPIYNYDYSTADKPALLESFYIYVYECLKTYKDYDVVGHLSIIDRYIGKIYDYRTLMDIIDEILKTIIYDGKGLEINTSNFRYRMGIWLPREEILRRYKELGGEILTFGSDAHVPGGLLDHFEEAQALARNIGFRYFTTYENRKPTFLRL